MKNNTHFRIFSKHPVAYRFIITCLLLLVFRITPADAQTQLIQNGNFSSLGSNWTTSGNFYISSSFSCYSSASAYAYFGDASGNYVNYGNGSIYQQVTIPSNATSATLSFKVSVNTYESTPTTAYDFMDAQLRNSSNSVLTTFNSYSNLSGSPAPGCQGYSTYSYTISPSYFGQAIRVYFQATTDYADGTNFRIDDVSLVYTASNPTYTISTSSAPSAGGTTTGGGTYNANQNITLTATPNQGWSFVNWTVNNNPVSSNASFQYTVTGTATVVANFNQTPTYYNITTSSAPSSGGTTSGSGTYLANQSVTLTATPAQGWTFVNWTVNNNPVSSNASFQYTVTGTATVVANFNQTPTYYNITTSSAPSSGGTTSGSGTYLANQSVTLTATPAQGWTFVNWTVNNNPVSSNASFQYTVTGTATVVANFNQTPTYYNITTSSAPSSGGTTSGSGTYLANQSVTLTATPAQGWTFVNWTVNNNPVSSNASFQYTVTGNTTVVANFNQNPTSADLTISNPNTNIGTLVPLASTQVIYTIQNLAAQSASNSITSFFISSDPVYNSGIDLWLADDYVPSIAPSSSLNRSSFITIPINTPAGNWYILLIADAPNSITELNENNNMSYTSVSVGNSLSCTDDYPYGSINPPCTTAIDPWNFFKHQCTSYVAWKINSFYGESALNLPQTQDYPFYNCVNGGSWSIGNTNALCDDTNSVYCLSHACHWDDALAGMEFISNSTPAVGSIAHWNSNINGGGPFGHVAFVNSVSGNTICITEYNWGTNPCGFNSRIIDITSDPNRPEHYIHIEVGGLGSSTGIKPNKTETIKLSINPNLTNGNITMSYVMSNASRSELRVMNTVGQLIYSQVVNDIAGENVRLIDLSPFENGIYFITLQTESGSVTEKVVLQK